MDMESKLCCMNGLCGAPISSPNDCKKGWPLRCGESATLCDKCGSAYEQLVFCDMFHFKDTGWRECISCGKRLHCGCIASSSLLALLDTGGVNCISCAKKSEPLSTSNYDKLKGCGLFSANSAGEIQSSSVGNHLNGGSIDKMKLTQLSDCIGNSAHKELLLAQMDDGKKVNGQMKIEESSSIAGEVGSLFLSRCSQASGESSQNTKMDMYKGNMGVKDPNESLVLTNLSIALSSPTTNMNLRSGVVVEEGEVGKSISSFQQGSRSRHLLPKPPKYIIAPGMEAGGDTVSQIRVARPPVEGRIKNQLLPRYWPRITDQELQQISGESSNATIVPLFEKVLSASDAGRIGRLVLPKACAEAYFPPISQPEGLPLRIQDVKGKEWVFQFRFWPNNNSRMYVLEGVTPCIQSMQLQAGDTVTFSRMDPGGKLLMGFRKASTTILIQETHLSALSKSAFSSEPLFPDVTGNLSSTAGYSGFLQSLKASGNSSFAKECNSSDMNLRNTEKARSRAGDIPLPPSMLVPERKRSRNIGSKSKRLAIDSQDALELKLSWEEVQDMLRPPSMAEPSIVIIEDHEFEEYEEPPVFGKRSIFTVRLSGMQEQWAQCDSCLKWRRLPADFLLPPNWSCQDNMWDDSRCSCSAPDELSPRELENLLKMNKDFKKLRSAPSPKPELAHEAMDIDALGNAAAAVGGHMVSDSGATSVATTTKHPRHRPGCSCIVCIQPPSGKGKHKPTCTCNVCMTVKRRFKTLMMRKKKRQSEREAEIAQRNQFMWSRPEELEVDSICRQVTSQSDPLENKRRSGSELQVGSQCNNQLQESAENGKGQLDLNSNPDHEGLQMRSSRSSMMSLLQEASMPLETYLRQNGLTSLVCEQQGSSGSQALPQATGESVIQVPAEDHSHPAGTLEEGDAELSEPDHSGNNPS